MTTRRTLASALLAWLAGGFLLAWGGEVSTQPLPGGPNPGVEGVRSEVGVQPEGQIQAGQAHSPAVTPVGLPPTAASPEAGEAVREGSIVSAVPLEAGATGLSVSGGVALALPFVGFGAGFGLGAGVDLVLHYEAVVGLLHFIEAGARWIPFEIGHWHTGFRLSLSYTLFGLKSDSLNYTSTLFAIAEVVASRETGQSSQVFTGLGAEVDLLEYVVLDGEPATEGTFRVDAILLRFGWQTQFTDELDVFVAGRLRVPLETFEYEDEQFFVIPFAEFGGTWSW